MNASLSTWRRSPTGFWGFRRSAERPCCGSGMRCCSNPRRSSSFSKKRIPIRCTRLTRSNARHRAWIGFGSECLSDIAGFYSAVDTGTLEAKAAALHAQFRVLDGQLGPGPWFVGTHFSLVDAVFAPVFRYFDTFDRIGDFSVFNGLAGMSGWRRALAARPSVRGAVAHDYNERLVAFLHRRGGALARMMPPADIPLRRSA